MANTHTPLLVSAARPRTPPEHRAAADMPRGTHATGDGGHFDHPLSNPVFFEIDEQQIEFLRRN